MKRVRTAPEGSRAKAWSLQRSVVVAASLVVAATVFACGAARGEGLDPRSLPEAIRPDYALFAQRCSKCHSLARPLQSGIDDDEFWARYVARMRQQPGSGISADDSGVILRFLHYFAAEQRRHKAERDKI
jgi:hypothetical protein